MKTEIQPLQWLPRRQLLTEADGYARTLALAPKPVQPAEQACSADIDGKKQIPPANMPRSAEQNRQQQALTVLYYAEETCMRVCTAFLIAWLFVAITYWL